MISVLEQILVKTSQRLHHQLQIGNQKTFNDDFVYFIKKGEDLYVDDSGLLQFNRKNEDKKKIECMIIDPVMNRGQSEVGVKTEIDIKCRFINKKKWFKRDQNNLYIVEYQKIYYRIEKVHVEGEVVTLDLKEMKNNVEV